MVSLQQYVDRAKDGQKSIFYIAADSLAAAASAPFVEQLIKKDLEVRPMPRLPSCVCHMMSPFLMCKVSCMLLDCFSLLMPSV